MDHPDEPGDDNGRNRHHTVTEHGYTVVMPVNPITLPAALSPQHQAVYAHQRRAEVSAGMKAVVWSSFGSADLHLASPDVPAERALIDTVVAACATKHIATVPDIYVASTSILNAASVSGQGLVYTTGILKAMQPEQLAAITGHELSHHRHSTRDMSAMLALAIVGSTAVSFAMRMLGQSALSSTRPFFQQAGAVVERLQSTYIPDYLGAMAAITPWRHYMELEADREGAAATSPASMKSALQRLGAEAHKPDTKVSERSLLNRVVRAILNPFPSHPSTESRIARMDALEHPGR